MMLTKAARFAAAALTALALAATSPAAAWADTTTGGANGGSGGAPTGSSYGTKQTGGVGWGCSNDGLAFEVYQGTRVTLNNYAHCRGKGSKIIYGGAPQCYRNICPHTWGGGSSVSKTWARTRCVTGALTWRFYGKSNGSVSAYSVSRVNLPSDCAKSTTMRFYFPNPLDSRQYVSPIYAYKARVTSNPQGQNVVLGAGRDTRIGEPTTLSPFNMGTPTRCIDYTGPNPLVSGTALTASQRSMIKRQLVKWWKADITKYGRANAATYYDINLNTGAWGDGMDCSTPWDYPTLVDGAANTPGGINRALQTGSNVVGTCWVPLGRIETISANRDGDYVYGRFMAEPEQIMDPAGWSRSNLPASTDAAKSKVAYVDRTGTLVRDSNGALDLTQASTNYVGRWRAIVKATAATALKTGRDPHDVAIEGTAQEVADRAQCTVGPRATIITGDSSNPQSDGAPPTVALRLDVPDAFQVGGKLRPDEAGTIDVQVDGPDCDGSPCTAGEATLNSVTYAYTVTPTNGYSLCASSSCDGTIVRTVTLKRWDKQSLLQFRNTTRSNQSVRVQITGATANVTYDVRACDVDFGVSGHGTTCEGASTGTATKNIPLEVYLASDPDISGKGALTVDRPVINAVTRPVG